VEEFVALLTRWDVGLLVDVRSVPRSRRNPQFNDDTLPGSLAGAGIEYVRSPALGGWRRPRPDSPNTGWRLESFRGYADYMLTDRFKIAVDDLISQASAGRHLAIMCAEAMPWRCHRSLISDAIIARGHKVCHIMSLEKAEVHRLTPFARVEGDRITYPPPLA
jgi:uncharacterized protein (DUF488 family)